MHTQGAQQQLQRIELLVKIQQFDNARMALRQGSFKSLRSDLRYESEYRGVQPEVRGSGGWSVECVAYKVVVTGFATAGRPT